MSDEETDIDESSQNVVSLQEEVSAICTDVKMEIDSHDEASPNTSSSNSLSTRSSSDKSSSYIPLEHNYETTVCTSNVASPEIYFLIWKFLTASPCSNAAKHLADEINQMKLLPRRLDWQGNSHHHSLESFSHLFSHLKSDHLLKLLDRNEVDPFASWSVVPTNATLLRSFLPSNNQYKLKQSPTRLLMAHVSGRQVIQSSKTHLNSKLPVALSSSPYQGPIGFSNYIPSNFYSKFVMHRRLLGHLSAVYCVCFDRTGKYIISGADDLLVKIWSAKDGRLISTLRGHSGEITDISVSHENTLIATGSVDKHIRIWCLQTTAPICVLTAHQQQVTTVNFCPLLIGETRYLVTTSQDGSVCFWTVNVNTNYVDPKPFKFIERPNANAHILTSSFSAGGAYLACGSTDHYIRVYHVNAPREPTKILEIEAHQDHVDSLVFSNRSLRFVSGSKDGHAHIWYFERSAWRNITLSEKGIVDPILARDMNFNVHMVGWSSDDKYVITSSADHRIRIWNSINGDLVHTLKGHDGDVFVIEAHPTDGRMILTAGHDARIIIWDIVQGKLIKSFDNAFEGNNGENARGWLLDLKISPDGCTFAATDSHAHVLIFGFGSSRQYEKVPSQVFFHTDYRPLVRDINNYVIDEQTQCPPHLMPPPFLVDIDGNPHPPIYQRLVPGRENCNDAQLVPHIAVHNERGVNEILQAANENIQVHQSALDVMIENLANQLPDVSARNNSASVSTVNQPQASSSSNASAISPQASSSSSSSSSSSASAVSASALTSSSTSRSVATPVVRSSSSWPSSASTASASSASSNVNLPHQVNADSRRNRNSNRNRINSVQEGVRSTGGNWQTIGGSIGNSSIWSRERPAVRPVPHAELTRFIQRTSQLAAAEVDHYWREARKCNPDKPVMSARTVINPKEKFTRRKKRLNEQRQGLTIASSFVPNNTRNIRNSNAATIRRHMTGRYVDEEQEENELSDTSFQDAQSGAESWGGESESSDDSSDESSDDSSSDSASASDDDDDDDNDEDYRVSSRNARRSTRLRNGSSSYNNFQSSSSHRSSSHKPASWQKLCKQMIEQLCEVKEFEPFTTPVDQLEYPEYLRTVDTPMDLSSLKEQLCANGYESLTQFKHDLELIVKNSRKFNTETHSQIYRWTTKFQKAINNHMRDIQSALRSRSKSSVSRKSRRSSDHSNDRRSSSRTDRNNRESCKKKVQGKKVIKKIKSQKNSDTNDTSKRDKGKRIVKVTNQSTSQTSPVDDIDVKPGPSGLGESSSSSSGGRDHHFYKSLVASDDDETDIDVPINSFGSETEIEDNIDFIVKTEYDSDATEVAEDAEDTKPHAISPSLLHDADGSLDATMHSNSTVTDDLSSECARDSPVTRPKRKTSFINGIKRKNSDPTRSPKRQVKPRTFPDYYYDV